MQSQSIQRIVLSMAMVLLVTAFAAYGQTSITPGTTATSSTIRCISLEWPCTGDSDHDATCTTEYRIQGSGTWLNAMPLLRCDNPDHNGFYGSIFNLAENTTYEVRMTITDPDGGGTSTTVNVTTRATPVMANTRTFHVEPGSGGGDGSSGNPFQGIAAAEAVAQAGDTFLLHAGDYGLVTLTKSGTANNWIVWKAAGDGNAVIQGMYLKSYVWLDGLYFQLGSQHLQNNDWINLGRSNGLTVQDSGGTASNVCVTRCTFRDFFHSVKVRSGNTWYFADNDVRGDRDPLSGGLQGEGIELTKSYNNIVCYNKFRRCADPVSYPGKNDDIYGNDIQDASDDGVETDGGKANVRVFENKITNICNNTFTFQPMSMGPWYFVRNQVVLTQHKIWKFANGGTVDDRIMAVNNTFILPDQACQYSQCLYNAFHKNNLYIAYSGSSPLLDFRWESSTPGEPGVSDVAFWMTEWDYNGYDINGKSVPFRSFGTDYNSFAAFVAGCDVDANGKTVDRTQIFANWVVPSTTYDWNCPLYELKSGTNAAVDAGVVLPNITDGYTGSAPDLGAFERGVTPPQYGPRPIGATYALTVTSGTGDGNYSSGQVVSINADSPQQGYAFSKWTGDTDHVTNHLSSSTTVTMPAHATSVTATYVSVPTYALTVTSGTGDGSYAQGTVVNITADTPQPGDMFNQWTGATQYVADIYDATTTVTMPAQAITVTATYTSAVYYTLTVNSGTGDGSYTSNQVVDIVADAPQSGYAFSKWTGDTANIENVNASSTTITMPAQNQTVTATYIVSSGDTFQESSGQVVMEVEHYSNLTAGNSPYDGASWQLNTGISGDSGDCMQALPNSGLSCGDGSTQGPAMNFKINFSTTGVYYFYLRMPAQVSGADDSCNVGMDSTIFQSQVANSTGAWSWRKAATTKTISTTGLHTLNIWMREDGCLTDKIVFTTNGSWAPAGTDLGPAESPVGGGVPTYTLTVTSGTGDGDYEENDIVNIAADTPPANYHFVEWTGDVLYVDDVNDSTTTVTIPAQDIAVTATYAPNTLYTLTVTSGTGDGDYYQGTVVNIVASAPQGGYQFSKWTGDTATVANVNASSTTVTMPAQAITVTATYVVIPTYTLTVTSGTGDGSYASGTVVNIVADAPQGGYQFDEWTGAVAYVANVNSSSTTVTMPASNITVTATYAAIPTYTLTVTSGTGDGSYTSGTVVNIAADAPQGGYQFSKWTGDTATVANVNTSSTTITMPSANASVTATYVPTGSGDTFQESSGMVVMEAEHYSTKASGSGSYANRNWELNTSVSGDSGDCMQVLPNSGANALDNTTGPVMNFKVNFSTTGVYSVLMRFPPLPSADNKANFGRNGSFVNYCTQSSTSNWSWIKRSNSITITTTGLHTINTWMRLDGVIVDKIILTNNSSYTLSGTDTGPAESQRQ